MRTFKSGAIRDDEEGKIDIEGHLSPLALMKFCEYMHHHRNTADGLRNSDDWQKGMPPSSYMKSLMRHFMDVWLTHRGWYTEAILSDALCGIIFNAMGMLHVIQDEVIDRAEKEYKEIADGS